MRTGEPMEIAWQLLKAGPPAEAFLPHDVDDEGDVIEENEPPKKDPLRSRLSIHHPVRRDDWDNGVVDGRPPGEEPLPEQHMAGQSENTRMNEMAREAAGTMPDPHESEPPEGEEPEPDRSWSPKDIGPYVQRLREMGLMDDDKPPTTAQTQGQFKESGPNPMSREALELLGREHAMRRR